ncbi:Boron transporter 2-like [Heracleum sosnowskyi]|uniref:Boron transporter 2-like n=1 Tax=Heracleum sosnowskyi TaxID=360622 RepID=A0AAD8IN66_9APIA|nr:Boron transporter 2-like [Heracleum sosnowskyi]
MLLVPIRQYILPKFFKKEHLQDLDAAEYEEASALPYNLATDTEMGSSASFADDREIFDGVITRSRGEIRRLCSVNLKGCSENILLAYHIHIHRAQHIHCCISIFLHAASS